MMRKLEERKWLLLGTGALILTVEVCYDYARTAIDPCVFN